ncbi:MAG: hypothetical protein KDD10_26015, partial [Phaeodactylibacter sp.]|nr:hypothetical protein [Phaeodactylibacter sp.]
MKYLFPASVTAFERPAVSTGSRLFLAGIAFVFLLLGPSLRAQTYETTGISANWQDPDAWICSGAGCRNNRFPNNNLENAAVFIRHDINFISRRAVRIGDNATVLISQGAKLAISGKLDIKEDGTLSIDDGSLEVGRGISNNDGTLEFAGALIQVEGNFINRGNTTLNDACVEVVTGNFINTKYLYGTGSVKTLAGNIINGGNWSPAVAYCADGNTSNLPGTEDCAAAEEICRCVLVNCDILPGYNPTTRVNAPIGSELSALAQTYDPNGPPPSNVIYTINSSNQVLIEIIVRAGMYNDLIAFLGTLGITPADFIDDRITTVNDELLITLFFPISALNSLNQRANIINFVRPVFPPLANAGLISSQGDRAQGSSLGRLGWGLSGAGTKVGIISDSYASNPSARDNDIDNGDLPGAANPVVVAQDYPFGAASDEGRAMLQIVHDVAPEAQLFFHTG